MNVMEGILTRRSIGRVKGDPVPKQLIEEILHAATFAPNHFRTEPWRFIVLEGDARNRLGSLFEDITKLELQDTTTEESQKKLKKVKGNPLRAPIIIAVAVEPQIRENVVVQEEYAAVHSAIQNMLLAAHSFGLGTIWRTGPLCYHEKVKEFFGLSDKGALLGFIYIGYPDMEVKKVKKASYKDVTTWLS